MPENGPSETGVHMAAIVAAFAVLAITSPVAETFELSPSVGAAGSVVFNAIVFGGAHLYLAARGNDGSVPVASRWRFLAFLGPSSSPPSPSSWSAARPKPRWA